MNINRQKLEDMSDEEIDQLFQDASEYRSMIRSSKQREKLNDLSKRALNGDIDASIEFLRELGRKG